MRCLLSFTLAVLCFLASELSAQEKSSSKFTLSADEQAVLDLTNQARSLVSDTFMAFEIWLTTAALYLLVTVSLSLCVLWLERRFRVP